LWQRGCCRPYAGVPRPGRLRGGRFDRLPPLESLFFCWPKRKVTQRKWPSEQRLAALCWDKPERLRMVVAGHPWEATQRVLPSAAQRARIAEDLKRSLASHRPLLWLRSSRSYAMRRTSPSPLAGEGRGIATFTVVRGGCSRKRREDELLLLALRGPRMTAAGGRRKARRVAGMDAGQFFDRTRMSCRKTPQPARVPSGLCPKGASSGVLFLLALPPSRWLLSLGQARESDPASGRRSEARRRRARSPQRDNQSPTRWIPACTGMTSKKSGNAATERHGNRMASLRLLKSDPPLQE